MNGDPTIPDPEKSSAGGAVAWLEKWIFRNKAYSVDATVGGTQLTHANISFGADATNKVLQTVPDAASAARAVPKVVAGAKTLLKGGRGAGGVAPEAGAATAELEELATAAANTSKAAKLASAVEFIGENANPIGQVFNAAAGGFEMAAGYNANDGYRTARGLGQTVGGGLGVWGGIETATIVGGATATLLAGTEAGAAIGSFIPIPVVGTAVGAIAGLGVTALGIWLGRKGGEAAFGATWAKSMNETGKAEQEKEIAPSKPIVDKMSGQLATINQSYAKADAEFQAAIKTNDAERIKKAKTELAKATDAIVGTKDKPGVQGLTQQELTALKQHKDALTKDYINLRAEEIPDSNKEAKAYQKTRLAALGAVINGLDATEKADKELKQKLPTMQAAVAKANTTLQKLGDERIAQIGTENEQRTFVKELMPVAVSMKKYNGKKELTEADVTKMKAEQAKLSKMLDEEKAKLNPHSKHYDPNYKTFAEQNIKDIKSFDVLLSTQVEKYETAHAADVVKPAVDKGTGVAPDPMNAALDKAKEQNATAGLSGAKGGHDKQDFDPARDKALLDRAVASGAVQPQVGS